jgi:hypothetical protein
MTNKILPSLTETELREFLYGDKDLTTEDFDNEFETGSLDDYADDLGVNDTATDEPELETDLSDDMDVLPDYTDDVELDSDLLSGEENTAIDTPVITDDAFSTIQNHISEITVQLTNVKVGEFKSLIQQLESLIQEARQRGREQLVESFKFKRKG